MYQLFIYAIAPYLWRWESLLDLDFAALTRRTFTPLPAAWEDQVLYFLLLDRFSDGNEQGGYRDDDGRPASGGVTPVYRPENPSRPPVLGGPG